MQFKLLWGLFNFDANVSFAINMMHPLIMSCIIPCMRNLFYYWLLALFHLFVRSSGVLDDDVEADDSYVYPTQDFDQYQAADPSGKLSHTWLTVSSPTGYNSSFVVYPC